ncbi:hypothetical protein DUI87_31261 [Hirundo rustica rustica]|uniref:Uncharacterized protein n=1 Tax=Hirundo rustica rustica TaxID=333673 RepID=A0A3M0IW70_HIRRU|nr:hypothetical protein DUI87_31261 [Hirundo rustica rustica]
MSHSLCWLDHILISPEPVKSNPTSRRFGSQISAGACRSSGRCSSPRAQAEEDTAGSLCWHSRALILLLTTDVVFERVNWARHNNSPPSLGIKDTSLPQALRNGNKNVLLRREDDSRTPNGHPGPQEILFVQNKRQHQVVWAPPPPLEKVLITQFALRPQGAKIREYERSFSKTRQTHPLLPCPGSLQMMAESGEDGDSNAT